MRVIVGIVKYYPPFLIAPLLQRHPPGDLLSHCPSTHLHSRTTVRGAYLAASLKGWPPTPSL